MMEELGCKAISLDRGLGVAIAPRAIAQSFAITGKIAILKLRSSGKAMQTWSVVIVRKRRHGKQPRGTTIDLFLQILQDVGHSR
ncbi:hypothetical protein [Granulicella arctica]|uniref:hypothetical protein n=1 Tax=Granulicella arctica TaxID=940613 RepID=UPI0021DF4C0B|nr:hypothetical protein [Granulicella arctica]